MSQTLQLVALDRVTTHVSSSNYLSSNLLEAKALEDALNEPAHSKDAPAHDADHVVILGVEADADDGAGRTGHRLAGGDHLQGQQKELPPHVVPHSRFAPLLQGKLFFEWSPVN